MMAAAGMVFGAARNNSWERHPSYTSGKQNWNLRACFAKYMIFA